MYLSQWGGPGSGPGQFNDPWGVALDPTGNFVYVTDHGNHRVEKFKSDGTFVTQWGSFGSGGGLFAGPEAVAVDATGDVYVTDHDNSLIQKFDSNGAFITQWGAVTRCVAADDSHVYCGDAYAGVLRVYDPNGTFLVDYPLAAPGDNQWAGAYGVALKKGSGLIYVGDYGNTKVKVLKLGMGLIDNFTIAENSDFEWLACDPLGQLYTCILNTGSGGYLVFDGSGHDIFGFYGSGSGNGQFNRTRGVAIDANGLVYIVDSGNSRIQKFGPAATPVSTESWGSLKAKYR
ncbi:MAG TPA: hypothetical protein VMI75_37230 [Polyangiaceae bacterium]|nr:hypothetical protein [Polyangiaceae bacterium]